MHRWDVPTYARSVAPCAWRYPANPRRVARNGRYVATNGRSIARNSRCIATRGLDIARKGRDVARNGRSVARDGWCIARHAYRRCRSAERCPTSSRESPRRSWSIGRVLASHRSDCVGYLDGDVGVREEERRKRSALEAHACGCLGMHEGFGQHSCERVAMHDPLRAMRDPFGTMPDANGDARYVARTALRRVGSDAPIERGDALREGRHAPPAPPDSPPAPPDAAPVPCDASRIRSDAVRRRRRRSRRVTRSSRTSLGALPGVDHAAAAPCAYRPIPRERKRVRGDAPAAPRDKPLVPRDAPPIPGDAPRLRGDAVRRRRRR